MTEIKGNKSTRRAFFLNGGAVLGAGVATTVGAATLAPQPQTRASAEDREAIRQLHLAFMAMIENQHYEAAAELFEEDARVQLSGVSASGGQAIQHLFTHEYRNQKVATLHATYRQTALQQKDFVTISDDGQRAAATFHCEAELCTPLQDDCTAAQMARLQGQMADRRWESGRFEGTYVRTTRGRWKVTSLVFAAT